MFGSARCVLLAIFLAVPLIPSFSSPAEEPMATQPEKCVFFGCPANNGLDYSPEQNLFLMANQGSLRAFDSRSGALRWHRDFGSEGARVCYGREHVLVHTIQELFLLDKNNGDEVWRRREDRYGRIHKVLVAPDESHVMVVFDSDLSGRHDLNAKSKFTFVLYDLGSQRQRVFGEENGFPVDFLPGSKTMLFVRRKSPSTQSSSTPSLEAPREFVTMDLDSGKMSEGHAMPDCPLGGQPVVSASGLLALVCAREGGPTGFKVFDPKTGALLRDLGEIPGFLYRTFWSGDGKGLYVLDEYQKKICVIDAQTGAIQQTFFRPGHELLQIQTQLPEHGPDTVLSQDEDRNIWSWPLTPDATPTKVFDGQRLSPGNWGTQFRKGGVLTACIYRLGEVVLGAYRMEDMQRMGAWRCSNPEGYTWNDFNRTVTHCACRITDSRKDNRAETEHTEIYAKDAEHPLFSYKGNMIALSPDGRYLMAEATGKRAELLDLQEKRTVQVFDGETEGRMVATFSDDGCRVAINAFSNLEVVDLIEGYPRRRMVPENDRESFICPGGARVSDDGQGLCFSPDGTLLLSGGYSGRAWLHDARTGVLLHTFTEPRRFLATYMDSQGGYLSSLEQSAKDWAGMVTDSFKKTGTLYVAFGALGDHVITHTAGQIIRVWDVRSGELINTVETGMPEKRDGNGGIHNEIVLSDNGDYALALNYNDFAPACLWSLMDGTFIRRYRFPSGRPGLFNVALPDDAQSVYVLDNGDLCRWPGRPKDAP